MVEALRHEFVHGQGACQHARTLVGDVKEVELKLEPLGSYSASSPHDCPKSKLIFIRNGNG